MCYSAVIWLSEVYYNVSIADSVYYNTFCIADMLQWVFTILRMAESVNFVLFRKYGKSKDHLSTQQILLVLGYIYYIILFIPITSIRLLIHDARFRAAETQRCWISAELLYAPAETRVVYLRPSIDTREYSELLFRTCRGLECPFS